MDSRTIIRKAVAIIKRRGWFPGDKKKGARCAALAINDAAKSYEAGCRARRLLAKKIGLVETYSSVAIGHWNDNSTKKEVIATMLRAAR